MVEVSVKFTGRNERMINWLVWHPHADKSLSYLIFPSSLACHFHLINGVQHLFYISFYFISFRAENVLLFTQINLAECGAHVLGMGRGAPRKCNKMSEQTEYSFGWNALLSERIKLAESVSTFDSIEFKI